jgi:ABC-type Fe3+-siderophore transport system permease subunit
VLAITFGSGFPAGALASIPLASLAGAVVASAIVYVLATRPGRPISTMVLLLAGVTLNAFFSALILFVQYAADFTQAYRTIRWLMGDLDVGSFAPIVAALPLVVVALGIFAFLPRSLNLLSVGADTAATRGVDVGQTQRLAFFSASLATAAAVSLAGPIGFVGIVVPHLVRLMGGRRSPHRAASVGPVRRSISRRVRLDRADGAGTGRSARRRGHRDGWRAVLPMAARQAKLRAALCAVTLLWRGEPCRARHRQPRWFA